MNAPRPPAGADCKIVGEVPGGCGAYAAAEGGEATATAASLADAQRLAVNRCNLYGGDGECLVRVYVCNSAPGTRTQRQPDSPSWSH